MNTNNIHLHSLSSLPKNTQTPLKDGSVVSVRVLKQTSGDSFVVAFGGGRFNVKSAVPLAPGSVFNAKIHVSGGKVMLIQQSAQTDAKAFAPVTVTESPSSDIQALFASLGLPNDEASKKIIQCMMQSGLKLNGAMLQKARRAAGKYPGREEEAAEAAIALEEEGFDCEAVDLEKYLELCGSGAGGGNGNGGDDRQGDGKKTERGDDKAAGGVQEIKGVVKEYFNLLCADAACADGTIRPDWDKRPDGTSGYAELLPFFNQYAGSKNRNARPGGAKRWITVPFTFKSSKISAGGGNGVFRVFVNLHEKKTEKLTIKFNFGTNKWSFAVYFNDGKCSHLAYNLGDTDIDDSVRQKIELLSCMLGSGKPVTTEWIEDSGFFAFGTLEQSIMKVRGFA